MANALCYPFLLTMHEILRKYSALGLIFTEASHHPQEVDQAFFKYMLLNEDVLKNFELWHGAVELPHKPTIRFDMATPFKTTKNEAIQESMMSEWLRLSQLLLTPENKESYALTESALEQKRKIALTYANRMNCGDLLTSDPNVAAFFEMVISTITEQDLAMMSSLEPEMRHIEASAQTMNFESILNTLQSSEIVQLMMGKLLVNLGTPQMMEGVKKIISRMQTDPNVPPEFSTLINKLMTL